ncbi:hypothetical protein CALVIDRAFT_361529 [Calocera viscosa TUFC12733]|uniref:Uncharacterized protein n=1 Tax=Calocera viscosa (strain TUFC12733) TaxID=1330018 RepID=A0A167H7C0_CALVF|nr:hypothetical protein CALVIDRAFT_361529 [Calocera viscosa TUFC12733]
MVLCQAARPTRAMRRHLEMTQKHSFAGVGLLRPAVRISGSSHPRLTSPLWTISWFWARTSSGRLDPASARNTLNSITAVTMLSPS